MGSDILAFHRISLVGLLVKLHGTYLRLLQRVSLSLFVRLCIVHCTCFIAFLTRICLTEVGLRISILLVISIVVILGIIHHLWLLILLEIGILLIVQTLIQYG